MNTLEWIVWVLSGVYVVVAFVNFIMALLGLDQPCTYLSQNERRTLAGTHAVLLLAALVVVSLCRVSRLHLLWLAPGLTYTVNRTVGRFLEWRHHRQQVLGNIRQIVQEMGEDGWDISKETFKEDMHIRPLRREFFRRIEAQTDGMLARLRSHQGEANMQESIETTLQGVT